MHLVGQHGQRDLLLLVMGLIDFSKHDSALVTIMLLMTRRSSLTFLPIELLGVLPLIILVFVVDRIDCVCGPAIRTCDTKILAWPHPTSRGVEVVAKGSSGPKTLIPLP